MSLQRVPTSGGAGTGRTFTPVSSGVQLRGELCDVQLRRGDSLETLAAEYGTSAERICEWNGVAFTVAAINAWVLSSGGKRLTYDPQRPVPGEPGKGWPVFTDSSVIKLPASGPRACASKGAVVVAKAGGSGLLLVGIGYGLWRWLRKG